MLGVKPSYRTGFAQWRGVSEYPQLWNGLVGAWAPFLGATGGQVFDLSGNGNTGTFGNTPVWTPGKFPAIAFADADDDYINCGNPSSMQSMTQLSVVCWFNVTSKDRFDALVWNDVENGDVKKSST